jgi:hypothetical protein
MLRRSRCVCVCVCIPQDPNGKGKGGGEEEQKYTHLFGARPDRLEMALGRTPNLTAGVWEIASKTNNMLTDE